MTPIGIYIHIPFCDGKCPYCDFFSTKADDSSFEKYSDALIEQIVEYSKKYRRSVDTVYFGGGTPSLIGSNRLCKILCAVQDSFDVDKNAEITAEINPTSSPLLDFTAMKKAGFNRLSIGLQSSNAKELEILGRKHTAKDAMITVEEAKRSGFDNFSLDLMLCLPYQTKKSLAESIKFCKDCDVQHISAYILKIEENTRFYLHKDTLPLFDDDKQADIYLFAVNELEKSGFNQYEISNFAKKGCQSKHNLKYWHDEEYLGFGPSAHSFIEKRRFFCDRSFDSFYDSKLCNESQGGDENEYIMLNLRLTSGLEFEKFTEKYGHLPDKRIIDKAKLLENNGLVIVSDNSIRLTVQGFLVSNSIISHLLYD